MIKFRVPIPDTDNTIIGPSIISILNRLKTVFHLDKYSHITLKNDENEYINKNWNIGDTSNIDANSNKTTSIEIEYSLSYEELNKNTVDYRNNKSTPILYSDETKFKTSVLYFDTTMNINFKILSKSKSSLNTILNELRMRYVTDRDTISHDLVYTYYLNSFFKTLISNFTYNKNLTYGTEITPSEYLSTLIDDRFTFLGVMDNDYSKVSLGFKEVQSGILGTFKNDMLDNKKTYDKDTGYWEASFEYQVVFKLPTFYDVEYYKIAYQYELDKSFTQLMTTEKSPIGHKEYNEELMSLFAFNEYDKVIFEKLKFNYLRVPDNDTDSNIRDMTYYINIFSVLFTLRNDDERIIFNLRDNLGFELSDLIIHMLEETEWHYINKLFRSIFNISIYCFNTKLSDDTIVIDNNLNVILNKELNKDGIYRIVFSLNNNLNILMPGDKNRVNRLYKNFLLELIELFNFLEYKSDIIHLGRNKIFMYERSKIIAHLMKG